MHSWFLFQRNCHRVNYLWISRCAKAQEKSNLMQNKNVLWKGVQPLFPRSLHYIWRWLPRANSKYHRSAPNFQKRILLKIQTYVTRFFVLVDRLIVGADDGLRRKPFGILVHVWSHKPYFCHQKRYATIGTSRSLNSKYHRLKLETTEDNNNDKINEKRPLLVHGM